MYRWVEKIVLACCEPLSRSLPSSRGEDYPSLWSKDLEKHSCGKFSFATVSGNPVCEDYGLVEPGRQGTFVGIYDGHGGPQASRFACDNLSRHLIRLAQERRTIDEEVLTNAFAATEQAFLHLVRERFDDDPLIASKGSCCLVGVIWNGTLYVANLGDSRAVLGHDHIERPNRIVAVQLTNDHNASNVAIRNELTALHPDDPNIVVYERNAWRVRGIIQVTRALGDAYLKNKDFALSTSYPKFHLKVPITRPVVRDDPEISSRNLQAVDRFVIFASDGLWELLTNEKAVEIVNTYPKKGIARRLLVSALDEAARVKKIKYDELKKIGRNERRNFHDDLTVVVLFIDHNMLNRRLSVPGMTVRGFVNAAPQRSTFNIAQQQPGNEEELGDMP